MQFGNFVEEVSLKSLARMVFIAPKLNIFLRNFTPVESTLKKHVLVSLSFFGICLGEIFALTKYTEGNN